LINFQSNGDGGEGGERKAVVVMMNGVVVDGLSGGGNMVKGCMICVEGSSQAITIIGLVATGIQGRCV
jgi:hypothetical protein